MPRCAKISLWYLETGENNLVDFMYCYHVTTVSHGNQASKKKRLKALNKDL